MTEAGARVDTAPATDRSPPGDATMADDVGAAADSLTGGDGQGPRDASVDDGAQNAQTDGLQADAAQTDAAQADATQVDAASGLPGDTCLNATPVTPGTITGQTTIGYTHDYTFDAGSCAANYGTRGRDRVYAITVPAGNKLQVTLVNRTSTWDPQLILMAGPASACAGATSCLEGVDAGLAGDNETILWPQSGTAPSATALFIVVSHFLSTDVGGDFDLTIALQ